MRLSNKEEMDLKREVKKKTKLNLKDIEIIHFSDVEIGYSYFKTEYDKCRGNREKDLVAR